MSGGDWPPTSILANPGAEMWGGSEGLKNCKGERIGSSPRSVNFAIWWDGDLLRELLDSNRIMKWDWQKGVLNTIFNCDGCVSNNGSKSTPALSADLFGDWGKRLSSGRRTTRSCGSTRQPYRRLIGFTP